MGKIVEEQARAEPGKIIPSLPLQEVRALIASKNWTRIKIEKVVFDGVADEGGRVVRIPRAIVVQPGPPPQSPTADYKDLTLFRENKEFSITIPKAQAGPVVRAIAKEQHESVPIPD